MTKELSSNLIIQFAKWPILGHVKTRLAASIGEHAALEAHKFLSRAVSQNIASAVARSSELDALLAFDQIPAHIDNEGQDFLTSLAINRMDEQQGLDLGERMAGHIRSYLAHHERVILVGSDCPSVDATYILQALEALTENDMVLGPASDGGYVLIGFRRFDDAVFKGVQWGGSDVLSATLANAQNLAWQVKRLDERWDVDELEDYQRWLKEPAP